MDRHLLRTLTRTMIAVLFLGTFYSQLARAQTAVDMPVLKGLAPVSNLGSSTQGKAVLAANYVVTGGIETGEVRQPTLLPFAQQQQQALQDAFITGGNLAQLADGLGTTLGSAYVARAHYIDRDHYTSISDKLADLIAYANQTSGDNSQSGKYFFANATTDGTAHVSAEAKQILSDINGTTDPFGIAYHLLAGKPGADQFGDSRPFQTERDFVRYTANDFFNTPSTNDVYNRGPIMDLTDSPSYPSGHTTYGYTGSILLAVLVPERYQQMVTRGAEYGNDRIIVGAHYAMDVLGGRTLALYDLAHLLANDPRYLNRSLGSTPPIADFRAAVLDARKELVSTLEAACGKTVTACAKEDTGRLSNPAANEAFYLATQTYNLPPAYPEFANDRENVFEIAPEAGYLLTVAFPNLTLEQADKILTETEGPGGGFLDNGTAFGVYSRLNLYAAAGRAAQATSH